MLQLEPTNDVEILDRLSMTIFDTPFGAKVGFVLKYDNQLVGVAQISINDEYATIIKVGVLPEHRGKGFGDFFTRVLMNNLSYISQIIMINYTSNYYLPFGFVKTDDGKMSINSNKIIFPSKCRAD